MVIRANYDDVIIAGCIKIHELLNFEAFQQILYSSLQSHRIGQCLHFVLSLSSDSSALLACCQPLSAFILLSNARPLCSSSLTPPFSKLL